MGRRKISIIPIINKRKRIISFHKRKQGLIKKACELSILCNCEIALIIYDHDNNLYQYASSDVKEILTKYSHHNKFQESLTNKSFQKVKVSRTAPKRHVIHMKGLPFQTTEKDIFEFFSPLKPFSFKIKQNEMGQITGEAEVEFLNYEDATKALNHNKRYIRKFFFKL